MKTLFPVDNQNNKSFFNLVLRCYADNRGFGKVVCPCIDGHFSPFSLEFESNSLHSCNRELIPYVLEQMRWQEWCNRRVIPITHSLHFKLADSTRFRREHRTYFEELSLVRFVRTGITLFFNLR